MFVGLVMCWLAVCRKWPHLLIESTTFVDIQVKEPSPDSLTKRTKTYLPPRFMSVKEAANQLLSAISSKSSEGIYGI